MIIFVDMDGVLVDFVGGVLRLFESDPEIGARARALRSRWPAGVYDLAEALEISDERMWAEVRLRGTELWADLQPYPWAKDLFGLLGRHGRVVVLSAPSRDPQSAAGKIEWLERHVGRGFREYLLGPVKDSVARPGAVLVDDRPDNIVRWTAAGGWGITFPQPWNGSARALADAGSASHWPWLAGVLVRELEAAEVRT